MPFEGQTGLILGSPVSLFSLFAYAFGVMAKKSLPIQGHKDLHLFSSRTFIAFDPFLINCD